VVALPWQPLGAYPIMSLEAPSTIDLAPNNPYSLVLPCAVIPAPGCAAREFAGGGLGAFVTRTATLHTRRGPAPRFAGVPAGLVITELPSVSMRTLLKEESRQWERSTLPVLVSLQGETFELEEMAATLENVESVSGLLIEAEDDIVAATTAVRRATPRPIVALLQHGPDIAARAVRTVAADADALVVAAPVRAAGGPDALAGYLLGPAAFPLTLQALLDVRSVVEAPIIAFGGIASVEFALTALRAGATALMIDAARWGQPFVAARIAQGLPVVAPA